jgi:hypothetical protein
MLWQENVQFPARCKPLPPGYRIVQLDSGHFMWTWGEDPADHEKEGFISWDRWWVRRCVFANYAERTKAEAAP